MNIINKISVSILIFLSLFANSLNVMACTPPTPECYSDAGCPTCYWCDNPGESTADCKCATVTSITLGSAGPFEIGGNVTVTAVVSPTLPSGCSIIWDDNSGITFTPTSSTTANAVFSGVVGSGIKIKAKTSCQSSWAESNEFTVNGVAVIYADIRENQIDVAIYPTEQEGTLKLELVDFSEENVCQLLNSTRTSSLNMEESFGDIGSLSAGAYDLVKATWTVDTWTPTDDFIQQIEVLGDYNHTCYNTADEAVSCTGTNDYFSYVNATNPTNPCGSITCGTWHNVTGLSGWLSEVKENGSGQGISDKIYSLEWTCTGNVHTPKLRNTGVACTSSSKPLLVGNVAINAGNEELDWGDHVLVENVGVVEVVDNGAKVAVDQLDHYTGVSGCNICTPPDGGGQKMTIKLWY